MTRRLFYIVLLIGSLMAGPVQAQDAPRPRTLVRAWLASQTERGRDIGRVAVYEQAEWTVDGSFGVRRIGWEAEVTGGPDTEGWQRDPSSLTINGRSVALRRWPELDRQRRGMLGTHAGGAARAVVQLHRLVANMQPSGTATREVIDGLPMWRIEMVPRNRHEAVERYTLWFDQDTGHLLRSRAVVRARRAAQPFIITSTYERVEGLDVPSYRLIEGTTQTKRRLRTYTLLIKNEASYTNYRFFRKDRP